MGRRLLALVALAALALLPAGTAAADGGRPLAAALTGAAEVPGPGDPDASGSASIALNQGQGTVCFDLSWADVDGTVLAAHIHTGTSDVVGPPVVPLFVGAAFEGTDGTSGCTQDVDRDLIKAIRQDPSAYYVNVHSTTFPAGAVRGQLSK
ncbi:MAG TPA: CHRD domain-containing protein [Actinomycetota bacterium]|nr:CHRD domain-containing protein [Actinomycetota bacterium]